MKYRCGYMDFIKTDSEGVFLECGKVATHAVLDCDPDTIDPVCRKHSKPRYNRGADGKPFIVVTLSSALRMQAYVKARRRRAQ